MLVQKNPNFFALEADRMTPVGPNFLPGRSHGADPLSSILMCPPEPDPDPLPLRTDVVNGWPLGQENQKPVSHNDDSGRGQREEEGKHRKAIPLHQTTKQV